MSIRQRCSSDRRSTRARSAWSRELRAARRRDGLKRADGRVRLRAGDATVEVTALAPDLFRVGCFFAGRPVDYTSEALAGVDWQPAGELREADGRLDLATGGRGARIDLAPLRIGFADADGRRFAADDPELGMGADGDAALLHKAPRRRRALLRLRRAHERPGEDRLRTRSSGTSTRRWATPRRCNNLYTSIPFMLALAGRPRARAVRRQLAAARDSTSPRRTRARATFAAAGGDLVYYVFAGPTPRRVLERYTELTGRMATAAAVGARQPAVALELHVRRRGARRSPAASASAASPATCSTSTSTTWTATASSPGTASASPTRPA